MNLIAFVIIGVLNFFLNFLPPIQPTSDIAVAIAAMSGYISSISTIIPVTTLIVIIGIDIAIEGAILGYKVIMWIIKKIPTLN